MFGDKRNLISVIRNIYFSWSRSFQIFLFILIGVLFGLAFITVRVSRAFSYLSDSPETCMNCHVMTDAYASWQRGSHGRAAVCNDCHVPHSNLVSKYFFKGMDGTKHSYVFTFRKEPQVLELSYTARFVVQSNCIRCHTEQLAMVRLAGTSERTCWDCHGNIHGHVHSLSASPEMLRNRLPNAGLNLFQKGVSK
jgi:cytochrome c nitrite reductase small subunit